MCINFPDNLLKAKAKSVKAEYTSDLNSDTETKRVVKRKRFFDEESIEDDISNTQLNCSFSDENNISSTAKQKSKY